MLSLIYSSSGDYSADSYNLDRAVKDLSESISKDESKKNGQNWN